MVVVIATTKRTDCCQPNSINKNGIEEGFRFDGSRRLERSHKTINKISLDFKWSGGKARGTFTWDQLYVFVTTCNLGSFLFISKSLYTMYNSWRNCLSRIVLGLYSFAMLNKFHGNESILKFFLLFMILDK